MIPAFPSSSIPQMASDTTNVIASMSGLIYFVLGLALAMLIMGIIMGFFGYYEQE